jgi:uncharacterized protein (DUF58 family)
MARTVREYTFRATAYFASSTALFILSLILSSEFLLVASLTGMSIIVLSLVFDPGKPTITKTHSRERIFEGEKLDIDLDILHRGKGGAIEVFEKLSHMIELDKGFNKGLFPPGRSRMRFTVKAPLRGYHPIGPTVIRRWGPLFLWFSQETLDDAGEVSVLPQLFPGRRGNLQLKRVKERPGAMHLRRLGMGKEFHSIRDYTPTDPFNTINWKAYARTGKLLVNQYEAETVTDVIILVDARNVSRAGPVIDNPLERSIRLCNSLSSLLIAGSNKVGIVIYGSSIRVLKPAGGAKALEEITHSLTAIESGGFNTLGSTVDYALPYLPPEMPVIILSSLAEDPTVQEAVRALRSRGHPITIVSPSGLDFERSLFAEDIPMYDLKAMERDNLVQDLRAMGAKVIDWRATNDVGWAIEEVWS